MDNRRNRHAVYLAVLLAIASLASKAGTIDATNRQATADKQGSLDELREWLNRRNQERKQLGTAVPEIPKHRPATAPAAPVPPLANIQPALAKPPAQDIGRGPDGRIHHRLLINDEGPDQLQVYSGSGYAPAAPGSGYAPAAQGGDSKEDDAHWSKLTPRGRQVWMSGKFLREPVPPRLKSRPAH